MHPITYGDYPASMRAQVGDRLPKFTANEAKMLMESIDFLGINYYTTQYASPMLSVPKLHLSYMSDYHVDITGNSYFNSFFFYILVKKIILKNS